MSSDKEVCDKFTYSLEERKDDGMGRSDKMSALKRGVHVFSGGAQRRWYGRSDKKSVLKGKVHIPTGGEHRRRDEMIRQRDMRSSYKFTYPLEERKDDEMG